MNSFLYIIPVTPKSNMNSERYDLQQLCLKYLLSQSYKKWIALWVSKDLPPVNDERIINVSFEGQKQEKLQVASQFIIDNKLNGDYIIRLDDDDLINPNILEHLKNESFDLMVDKHQVFWLYDSPYFSSRIWYWFPNTCIHKREHALSLSEELANSNVNRINKNLRLIENDHSIIHNYYRGMDLKFSSKRIPIYIRSITNSSTSSLNADNIINYYSSFGTWRIKKYSDFKGLTGESSLQFKQSLSQKLINLKLNLIALKNYNKIVI